MPDPTKFQFRKSETPRTPVSERRIHFDTTTDLANSSGLNNSLSNDLVNKPSDSDLTGLQSVSYTTKSGRVTTRLTPTREGRMAPPPPPPPARPSPTESPASSLGAEGPRPVTAEEKAKAKRDTLQGRARAAKKKEKREVGASPGKAVMARKARDVVGFNPKKASKKGRGVRANPGSGFRPTSSQEEEEEDGFEDISDGELDEEVRVKVEKEDDDEVVCLTPAPPAQHIQQPDGSIAIYQPPFHIPKTMEMTVVKQEPKDGGYSPDPLNQAVIASQLLEQEGRAPPGTPELHKQAAELLGSSPGGQATPPQQVVIHHTTNNIAIQYTPPPPPPPPQVFNQIVYQSSPIFPPPPPPGFEPYLPGHHSPPQPTLQVIQDGGMEAGPAIQPTPPRPALQHHPDPQDHHQLALYQQQEQQQQQQQQALVHQQQIALQQLQDPQYQQTFLQQ